MKMLGGDSDVDDKSPPMDSVDDGSVDPVAPDEGFTAAADEVFSAFASKNVDAFASALKTCIDMSK